MFGVPELEEVFEIMTMPLQRAFTLIMSLRVGVVSIGGLLIVGVLIAVLIEFLMHLNGATPFDVYKNSSEKGN